MRLLTWNVAGRVKRHPEQAAAVLSLAPDVVALQEVTKTTLPLWRATLADAGLEHSACPLDHAAPPKPRRLGVLTASRAPIEELEPPPDLPWFERVLAVRVDGIEIVNVHSPISPSPDLAKVRTHEAVAAYLQPRDRVVLCGDLNTPRRDLPDGTVLTFAHESDGSVRSDRGERWVDAERALVQALRLDHGWRDPFLEHGAERTWRWPNGGGWRLDHVLTKGVETRAAIYVHAWREQGLSDHSALVIEVSPYGPRKLGPSVDVTRRCSPSRA